MTQNLPAGGGETVETVTLGDSGGISLPKLQQIYHELILAFFAIYAFYRSAFHLGNIIENSIDSHQPLSYIQLTKGDETLIAQVKREKDKNLIMGFLGLVGAIIQTAVTNYLVDSLFNYFHH